MEQTKRTEVSTTRRDTSDTTRLTAEVARRLKATGRFSSDQVNVSASDGKLRLRGRVTSYYQKQLAQAIAMKLTDGRQIENDMEVI